MLSLKQRVFLIRLVFKNGDEYTERVKQDFRNRFPDTREPHRNIARGMVSKFSETGSVQDGPRSGSSSVLPQQILDDISDRLLQSPKKSLRKLTQQTGLSYGSTHKAVKIELKLFPYKVSTVQQLENADYQRRLNYCEWFTNSIAQNREDNLDVTSYTGEAWLHLSGHVNTKNTRLWFTENPHAIFQEPLHSNNIGVWVATSTRRTLACIFY
jgi:hypothetical protein